jgi:hypothetical protein
MFYFCKFLFLFLSLPCRSGVAAHGSKTPADLTAVCAAKGKVATYAESQRFSTLKNCPTFISQGKVTFG